MFNFWKKKKEQKPIVVHYEIISCSKFYVIHNFITNKYSVKEVHKKDEKSINPRTNRTKR